VYERLGTSAAQGKNVRISTPDAAPLFNGVERLYDTTYLWLPEISGYLNITRFLGDLQNFASQTSVVEILLRWSVA
jgi:hypothetical protein